MDCVEVMAESADLSGWTKEPHKIAVDGKGYVWRMYTSGALNNTRSMAPVNSDNSPIPEPITYYVPEASLLQAKREVLERLKRRAGGFGYVPLADIDAELASLEGGSNELHC